MFVATILLPAPAQEARRTLEQQVSEQVSAWHRQWLAEQYTYLPPNIRFDHDPHWRDNFWSMTAAADETRPGWSAVRMLFSGSTALFGVAGFAPVAVTGGMAIAIAVVVGCAGYEILAGGRRDQRQPGSS